MNGYLNLWNSELFDPSLGFSRFQSSSFVPSADVEESESHYLVSFDMPGIAKEDVKIEVLDDELVVTGERRSERAADQKMTRHVLERSFGKFQRTVSLPQTVVADKIEALYKDGVLTIALPKTPAVKPRSIEISSDDKQGFFDKLLGKKNDVN